MRKFVLIVVLVLSAGVFCLDNAIQSPRFWEYIITKAVALKARDVKLEEIHIARVEHHGLESIILDAVTAKVRFKDEIYFLSAAQVRLDHLSFLRIDGIKTDLSGEVNGTVQGDIHLDTQGDRVKDLKARFYMLPQGTIKAELLQYLAQYLPQRQEIEALVRDHADIPLDTAVVAITSVSDRKFLYNINLYAPKLNLKMNVDIDMNMDGNIKDLLGRL